MTDYSVKWAADADKDVQRIVEFIGINRPETAERVLARILVRAKSLAQHPERGPEVRSLSRATGISYRQITEGRWRIIYWIDGNSVRIFGVLDASRDLNRWLHETGRIEPNER